MSCALKCPINLITSSNCICSHSVTWHSHYIARLWFQAPLDILLMSWKQNLYFSEDWNHVCSNSDFLCQKMSVFFFFFLQEIQRKKVEYLIHIPDEPRPDHPEAVHIVIKLPNGMRLERRFLESQSLEVNTKLHYTCVCLFVCVFPSTQY